MEFGYLRNWTLRMVIGAASEGLLSKAWLIVALDANRGEKLRESYAFLKERLPETARWTGAGIRVEGRDLAELNKDSGILVPFSAVYVLDEDASENQILYNLTSESEKFESILPNSLKENFLQSGFHAYFADGCGLNYCLTDTSFSSLHLRLRMTHSNDWRLTNQEEYLKGATLQWRRYNRPSEAWDHDHCAFCWAKFMEGDALDVFHEGYVTDDNRHWICETCVEDFKDMFQWRLFNLPAR
jgi:hypothetical protein